jgi:hypothetical protein
VTQREWRRLHLRGAHWWEGTSFPTDRRRENARADSFRLETEGNLTKLLADEWTMISVIAARPVLLFQTRVAALWQEAFTVFLERDVKSETDIE